MENFLSILLFTLPGLMGYIFINMFGLTPSNKRENTEVIALSALLWVPTFFITLAIYNSSAKLSHWSKLYPTADIPVLKKEWTVVKGLSDITKVSDSFSFLIFFVICSILISYFIARSVSGKGYRLFLKLVNIVRAKNKLAPLSDQSTVWNEMFQSSEAQIVEFIKEGEEQGVIGCIIKAPRPQEPEKALVLEAPDHWRNVIDRHGHEVEVDSVYINTHTGFMIRIYNTDQALAAQQNYLDSFTSS